MPSLSYLLTNGLIGACFVILSLMSELKKANNLELESYPDCIFNAYNLVDHLFKY